MGSSGKVNYEWDKYAESVLSANKNICLLTIFHLCSGAIIGDGEFEEPE